MQLLTGVDASEMQVRAAAPDRSILHFAGHSVIRDDRPMDSFLALAGEAADPAGDGRLTAFEIYGLHLDASLVVLSACRSAGGKVTGDGVVGLVRAFLYAGAPSVIASVWDLPDETAPWLFERFYRAGGGRQDSGAALRVAQLALLRALARGHLQHRDACRHLHGPRTSFVLGRVATVGRAVGQGRCTEKS